VLACGGTVPVVCLFLLFMLLINVSQKHVDRNKLYINSFVILIPRLSKNMLTPYWCVIVEKSNYLINENINWSN
jgi:hypothetical protein